MAKTITRDNSGNLLPEYCNFRLTRKDGSVKMDYHLSIREAAEDALAENVSMANVDSVEWKGIHIGENWTDATDHFKAMHGEASNAL